MYIAIDIGGTNIRVAAADNLEKIHIGEKLVFKNNHNFEEYMDKIVEFCGRQGSISAAGISTNGTLNKDKTVVIGGLANTPEKTGKPIVKILKSKLNCSVVMENDAVAAALAEKTYGRYNLDEFIYIIWGTGIGSAIARRENGELKVEQIDWLKYLEEWEADCGGNRIGRKFGKQVSDLSEEEWAGVVKDFKKHLLKLTEIIKIKQVILGGGIAISQFDRIKNIAPELYLTCFGEDAGLYGAFALINFSYSTSI